jgi:hypothetical protein
MNERIQELAKQATIRVNNPFVNSDGKVVCDGWEEGISISKFAELIVLECMTMCDELQALYLKNRRSTTDFDEKNIYAEGEAACAIIKCKMKKQFGVE